MKVSGQVGGGYAADARNRDPARTLRRARGGRRACAQLHRYEVIGRRLPSEKEPTPELFRMRIFAPDEIVARSRFWYFISKLKKLKRSKGEIVSTQEVRPARERRCIVGHARWLVTRPW